MKKILLSALCLSVASVANAADDKFAFTAEYLSLTPSGGDGSYVVSSPASAADPIGDLKTNRLTDEPGYRLDLSYGLASGSDIFIRAMQMKARQVENTYGDFLWATIGTPSAGGSFDNYPGAASSDRRVRVGLSDIGIRQTIGGEQSRLSLSYALQYAEIKQEESIHYNNTASASQSLSTRSSSFYGVGPNITLGFAQPLVNASALNVLLDMSVSAGLLAGKTTVTEAQVVDNVTRYDVSRESDNQVAPNFGARLGVAAEADILGLASTFALGYELSSYTGAIHQLSAVDDVADGSLLTEEKDLGLQGYYASVRFAF